MLGEEWNELLKNPEQMEKLKESLHLRVTPYYLSSELLAGTFSGENKTVVCFLSGNKSCNCGKYRSTEGYPCIHMYRLAYEFGFIDENGKRIIKKEDSVLDNKEEIFKDIIELIEENLSWDKQLNLGKYPLKQYISNNRTPVREEMRNVKPYIECGLFEICRDSNIGLLYKYGYRSEITHKIDKNGFIWPSNLARIKSGAISAKAKQDWCLSRPNEAYALAFPDGDDEFIMVRPSEKLVFVYDLLLQYLERKYYDEKSTDKFNRYTILHPTGSVVSDYKLGLYEFPKDIVTDQLTNYGFNRCLNKEQGIGEGSLSNKGDCVFSFGISIPNSKDYETLSELLILIDEFYTSKIQKITVDHFWNIIKILQEIDKYIDKVAKNSIDASILLYGARLVVNQKMKKEDEIKRDFKTVEVVLKSGEKLIGFENIVSSSCSKDDIEKVLFP